MAVATATPSTLRLHIWHVKWLIDNGHATGDEQPDELREIFLKLVSDGTINAATIAAMKDKKSMTTNAPPVSQVSPVRVFGGINVKPPSGKFDAAKSIGVHRKWGQSVLSPFTGRPVENQSEAEIAQTGALLKYLAGRAGLPVAMQEWERSLLAEMANQPWCGKYAGDDYDSIVDGARVKALLDDVASGGISAVPVVVDQALVSFPLLMGELYPRVEIVNVPAGRRIEGASISTPTMSWGGGDDATIGLFDTASLVGDLDSSIFTVDAAIEVGRDFLADNAYAIGNRLTGLLGERLSAELDKVIALGNGTTQPEGITNASGVIAVTTDNAGAGPPTLNDYTELMFAIGKQYRTPSMGCAYLSNDTTYQRSRAIRVDPQTSTTDQRPVLTGGDTTSFNNYQSLGWPHAIQNDLGNRVAVFGAMRRYRMYRRSGLEIRWEMGGSTLARKNLALLIARARFGGVVTDPNAFAKWTDGQS